MLLAVARDKASQLPDGEGEVRTRPNQQVNITADGYAVGKRVVALVSLDQLHGAQARLCLHVLVQRKEFTGGVGNSHATHRVQTATPP